MQSKAKQSKAKQSKVKKSKQFQLTWHSSGFSLSVALLIADSSAERTAFLMKPPVNSYFEAIAAISTSEDKQRPVLTILLVLFVPRILPFFFFIWIIDEIALSETSVFCFVPTASTVIFPSTTSLLKEVVVCFSITCFSPLSVRDPYSRSFHMAVLMEWSGGLKVRTITIRIKSI